MRDLADVVQGAVEALTEDVQMTPTDAEVFCQFCYRTIYDDDSSAVPRVSAYRLPGVLPSQPQGP